jgi:VCBS repeat protein/FG-GAP repeat protein
MPKMKACSFRGVIGLIAATLVLYLGGCGQRETHPVPDLFYLYHIYAVGKHPTSIVAGDLDGDGLADLITANIGNDTLSILLGNGDGSFRDPRTLKMPEQPRALVLHDLDGDGLLDLAVANAGNHQVTILTGDGHGNFKKKESYAAVKTPVALACADFNKDGRPDLAVALRNDKLMILLGRGDGTFFQKAVYEYGDTPTSVVVADVNEDGVPDIAVTQGGQMSSAVAVLIGKGDGTFHQPALYKTGHRPLTVAIVDLNGDRHADMLVVNGEMDDITVFFGKGDGSFTKGSAFGANAGPSAVASEDFDGDGKPDVAVVNNLSNDLSIVLGKGDGTFWQPPRNYRTGTAPFAVAAVTFAPKDPRPGLVTANNQANTISVFLAKDPRSHLVPAR